MPRILLEPAHLETIQQALKENRGVDFNTSNEEAVFSMLKYWCREAVKEEADVESVVQKDERFLVSGNREFLRALQEVL